MADRAFQCYFGDIHNHCGVSYGHGPVEDAVRNARLQLDFVSVTGHSSWPDLPEEDERLKDVVAYHQTGFEKLERDWDAFLETMHTFDQPGSFVAFPSYEVHSLEHGDHTVFFTDPAHRMIKPADIPDMQRAVREKRADGDHMFLLPHHIGYRPGYRGINWDTFREDVSPIVEIVSMHGSAESDGAEFPYLHSMGPRHGTNTMQDGLARGYHFGVTGSTDHHSAHPGSHGYGKVAVWAEELTREALWKAFAARRTYAVTGDRIRLAFGLNDAFMGDIVPYTARREITVDVKAGDAVDYVEFIKNNRVIRRVNGPAVSPDEVATTAAPGSDVAVSRHPAEAGSPMRGKVFVELGWGDTGAEVDWDVSIDVAGGTLLDREPRLHGHDTVDPAARAGRQTTYHFSEIEHTPSGVRLITKTWGNPNTRTNANQGVCLELEGTADTEVVVTVRRAAGTTVFRETLADLVAASRSRYLERFLSGAVFFHRFVPAPHYEMTCMVEDHDDGAREDWYYVRVRQRNGHWAYSSPIWVQKRS